MKLLLERIKRNITEGEMAGIICILLVLIIPEFFLKIILCGALCYVMGRKRWGV